ncbi:swi5-like zinc finger protein [Clydaea vesicula]|uniref:Swi5-like zinc finger protein n=1 Tax=Clydaea vesicula TaxID=447962 RepID=A0AAD5TYH0_9FUNG|nr:swi5-like zinc finger protein [Clydaea vesicula]
MEIDVEKELKLHIERLHQYNEIKDVGQLLFGKCADNEGLTTKDMYAKFDMELED